MSDPVYCYPPDHTVLRNKLDIRDARHLDRVEQVRWIEERERLGPRSMSLLPEMSLSREY